MSCELIFATTNSHKLHEAQAFMGSHRLLAGAIGPVVEDAPDFFGNALIKARAGIAAGFDRVVAEDSGLVITTLSGRPGVHSQRYAATDALRIARVLEELSGESDRSAAFVAVVVALRGDGSMVHFQGRVEGVIADAPSGDDGFGYDPIFIPAGSKDRTFAQMTSEEKGLMSHRGVAFRQLCSFLDSENVGAWSVNP
ncbi:MAG: RdgB/HAM1 family non-canonical purine NTP pyrophosphatase [Ferrimicrobium sp.]